MALRIEHLCDLDRRHAIGGILVTLAALVLDDVALRVDGLGRHRVDEESHPVRLQEQRQVERVRGDVDVVVGAVFSGRGVVGAADRLEELIEGAVGRVLRSHEHQVLEQVGEPGPPDLLACRADVVPHVHRDERNRMIFVQDDVQAVRQIELRVGDVEISRGLLSRGRKGGREDGRHRDRQQSSHGLRIR